MALSTSSHAGSGGSTPPGTTKIKIRGYKNIVTPYLFLIDLSQHHP